MSGSSPITASFGGAKVAAATQEKSQQFAASFEAAKNDADLWNDTSWMNASKA